MHQRSQYFFPFLDVSGAPKKCGLNEELIRNSEDHCPLGYTCRITRESQSICCTIEGVNKFLIESGNKTSTLRAIIQTLSSKKIIGSVKGGGTKPVEFKLKECRPNEILTDGICVYVN